MMPDNKPNRRRNFGKLLSAAVLLASSVLASPSHASIGQSDPLLEGAKLCTRYLPRHEREYGIPVHLLAAIASTESGRYHEKIGLTIPWPWTINAEGKGYFFDTKEEAIAAVQKLQAHGIESIDVGCMQVNLKHHPNAFSSLEDAFDPRYNVAYAAHFLRSNYDDLGNWRAAAAAYHSRTPQYGNSYVYNVYSRWNQILTKLAEAKGGKPVENADFASVRADEAPLTREQLDGSSGKKQNLAFNPKAGAKKYARQPIRMRVIELAKQERSRENGVLVIRPHSDEQQIAMAEPTVRIDGSAPAAQQASGAVHETTKAEASTADLAAIEPAAGQFNPRAKLIRLNRGGKVSDISDSSAQQFKPRKPPQFVFDN